MQEHLLYVGGGMVSWWRRDGLGGKPIVGRGVRFGGGWQRR